MGQRYKPYTRTNNAAGGCGCGCGSRRGAELVVRVLEEQVGGVAPAGGWQVGVFAGRGGVSYLFHYVEFRI